MTNHPESVLGRTADHVIPLHAGFEQASTTKTYLNTILALHVFLDSITGHPSLSRDRVEQLIDSLIEYHPILLERTKEMLTSLDISHSPNQHSMHIVARGPMFSLALQSALILQETTDLLPSGLSGGTFRHGPYDLAGPHHRVIFLAPAGPTQSLIVKMAQEVHQRGSKVVLVSDVQERFPFLHITVPSLGEDIAPALYFLVFELFGYHVALQRQRTPGVMKYMDKVTRVE